MKKLIFRLFYTIFVAGLTIAVFISYKDLKTIAYKKQLLSSLNWAKKVCFEEIKEQKPFVVAIPSYRNEEYCEKNLRSVFEQKYDNYRVIYVDDASPDNTYEKVKEIVTRFGQWDRFTLLKNEKNRGAMFNHVQMSQYYRDDEIIVNLDGDDFFASDEILKNLNAYYANPDVWLTYGQYITYPEYRVGLCKPMKFSQLKNGVIRDLPWVTSALRTFYGGLFRRVNIEDFLYEGSFLPMACDLAYMFPLVELARQHVYFTPDIAYIYNRATGINDDKKSRSKQVFFEQYIRAAPRYEPLIEHPASKPSIGVVKNTDVLIFESNRPVELFATLESLEPYRDRIGEIFVFYSANYSKMNVAYERLKADFSHVHFICQNKNELLAILTDPSSDHVLIVSEGTVFKRDCDFKEAVEDLERSQLSSYSFYLDKTLLLDYQQIIPLKGLREGLYGVVFSSEGRVDFEKSSRSYGTLYRKNTIKSWLEDSASFTDFLEKWPLHHQGKNSIVICKERPAAFHVSQLTQACEEFSTKEGLGCMADKCSGKSSKVLPQIFVNECESIICIDEASSRLQKDEVTDCVEFSSVCEKCRLDEYIDVISKGAI